MRNVLLLIFIMAFSVHLYAQKEDLMSQLDSGQKPTTNYAYASFKSTRVVNAESLENDAAGVMDFRISHRFGALNSGLDGLWGLDAASLRIGLEYGVTKWLEVGLGINAPQNLTDGFVKAKILRQSTGAVIMPITVVYFGGITSILPPTQAYTGEYDKYTNRLTYTNQLIIGRKLNDAFTIEVLPTFIHRNLAADTLANQNDETAVGVGGRWKFAKSLALNGEYFFVTSGRLPNTYNSASIGFDIETGGHVFQLFVTNSPGTTEPQFIGQTPNRWRDGGIIFGFNISRVFTIVNKEYTGKY